MGDGEVREAEGERFRSAAALDEFGELELDYIEAGIEEAGGEVAGDFSGEDGAAEVEGAAGHVGGVELGYGDAAVDWIGVLDGGVGGTVKSLGVVEDVAASLTRWASERGEAGVEVIESGVGEVEGADGDMPRVGYVAMRGAAGANAVGGPESGAVVVEGEVAFAFDGSFAGGFPEEKTLRDEPAAKVGGFGSALLGVEAGDSRDAVVDESAVGKEDHIGTAGLGMKEANVGDGTKNVVHSLPLGKGQIARGAVDVAGHPGIQDVVDVVPLRGTHEKGGAGELGRGGEDVWGGG